MMRKETNWLVRNVEAAVCVVLFALPAWPADPVAVPGGVTAVQKIANGIELTSGPVHVRVLVVAPRVIRVRYSPSRDFPPDHSFAVLPNAFSEPAEARVQESAESVSINTGSMVVKVFKARLRIQFLDAAGKIISQDRTDDPVIYEGSSFRVWKAMPEDEHYFGLGDKTGPLDHRGLAFTLWNTDTFGWQESTDPLYKSVPFFLALRNGLAYGVFLDNTYRSNFEFGVESRDAYSFGAEGGELNYYFFYGPDPKQVVRDFTTLVGRMPLPPLFALGYQQCRYSYYPEARVREIATEFRKRSIPADVLYLDIDYQQDNRPFTINGERFPHFQSMIKDLLDEGFKTVAITDLHLAKLPGYKPYDQGIAGDYFVKNPDGSVYVGKVWPGDSVFPDFTRSVVRDWWGTLYSDFVKMGIRGFWNDMNEPAVFRYPEKTMPLDTVHRVDGRGTDHREIHNVFGMENARATYEGLLRLEPNLRPFVLTRAAFAGTQRYASTWTGDNSSTWNHMRISVPQLLNLGISGFPFVGDDIGGFNGSPTPALLTRWMELGAFNPIYRNHAAKGTRDREPWVDGPEHEAIRKRYIEMRYQLLPYIYTGIEESSRTGLPLMRPMFLEFPDQPELTLDQEEFMFGKALLVAPKVWEFVGPYEVQLPSGDWYDFWTGKKISGGKRLQVDPALDVLPVLVRAGSILPQQPIVQNVSEKPAGPLELRVYVGPQCGGDLYLDDGNTMAYRQQQFLRIHFSCEQSPGSLEVKLASPEGKYQPWFNELEFVIYGVDQKILDLSVDGQPKSSWTTKDGTLVLSSVPWLGGAHEVRIRYDQIGR